MAPFKVAGAERVPLIGEILGVRDVRVIRCRLGSGAEIPLIILERDSMLDELHRQLRVAGRGELNPELVAKARSRWGYALWSRLRPDIGHDASSRSASLGKRRVYFKEFFRWLQQGTTTKDLWGFLEKHGAAAYPNTLPSFVEWKKMIHFDPALRPTRDEIDVAKCFLDEAGSELAAAEDGHRSKERWRNYPDDRLPEEFFKWVRGDVKRLIRTHKLSDGVIRAATLLSYAFRVQLGNWVAEEVLRRVPTQLLSRAGMDVYRHMWLASEVGLDDDGRFDLPIMGSPPLASAIEYIAEVSNEGTLRDKEGILADVLEFTAGGRSNRNRGVNIALGIGRLYQAWLKDERDRDREKTRKMLDLDERYRDEVRAISNVSPGATKHVAARARPSTTLTGRSSRGKKSKSRRG